MKTVDVTCRAGKRVGLNAFILKIIAIVSMLIDHIGAGLFSDALWMRAVGRLAFPIFAFFICEGFVHTHNIKKYAFRLGIFAIVSEIPFNLLHDGKMFDPDAQNIFFTLLIGLLTIFFIDKYSGGATGAGKRKNARDMREALAGPEAADISAGAVHGAADISAGAVHGAANDFTPDIADKPADAVQTKDSVIAQDNVYKPVETANTTSRLAVITISIAGMIAAQVLRTDYAAFGVAVILLFYYFREKREKALLFLVAANLLPGLLDLAFGYLPLQALAGLAAIPLYFYNGKKGPSLKYAFYAFYPAHIAAIMIVKYFL